MKMYFPRVRARKMLNRRAFSEWIVDRPRRMREDIQYRDRSVSDEEESHGADDRNRHRASKGRKIASMCQWRLIVSQRRQRRMT